jgi:hypothetical protein
VISLCEVCGEPIEQFGRGRPAKRCSICRASDRYGVEHERLRAELLPDAVGSICPRCGEPIEAGQAVDLGHVDGGAPDEYQGLEHAACNRRAAAVRGNQARAAAYRAARGLPANGGVVLAPAEVPRHGDRRGFDGEWFETYSEPLHRWIRRRVW